METLEIINVNLDNVAETKLIDLCTDHLIKCIDYAEQNTSVRFVDERIAAKRFRIECEGHTNRYVIETMHALEMDIEGQIAIECADCFDDYDDTCSDDYADF